MNLLRLTPGFLALTLLAAIAAPAGADQIFTTVSTGPVYSHGTPPPYPLGDIYYGGCGWNGNFGGGHGRGMRGGSTTLTGERFYPFDIRSDGNRTGSHGGRHGNGFGNCGSPSPRRSPHP